MRIAVEINSIEELAELAEFGQKMFAAAAASGSEESFEPEDCDEEIFGDDDCDNAGRVRLGGTDADWARMREMAGLEGERAGQSVGAPNKKEYYIAPSKLADIDVYVRVAQELGEFGPKFFRDKWQEIKALYQTYKDEGVPGRKIEPATIDVAQLRKLAKSVEKVDDIVAEVAVNSSQVDPYDTAR